jgi:hypothetical protein
MVVPLTAISRLVALEEFGANLPQLVKKRRAVQALRRREDVDIIELFKTALEPGFDGPGFNEFHRALVQALRLDRLVEVRPSSERPASHA